MKTGAAISIIPSIIIPSIILTISAIALFGFCFIDEAEAGWVSGRFGSAINFDGTNDYVKSNSNLPGASAFSYSLWFKSSDGSFSANEYLFTQGTDDPSVFIGTNGKINVYADGASKITSSKTFLDTNWHHLEITADGSTIKLYLDGILESLVSYTGSSATGILYVASNSSPGSYFGGIIDDVRVYNYARTADEIRLDYNAGYATHFGPSGMTCAQDPAGCMDYGLVGYWGFNEGSGTTAYNSADGTTGSNNGTLTNGPKWTRGKISGGLQFDGTNDYVNCGNGNSLQISGSNAEITLEAWVYSRNLYAGGAEGFVINKGVEYYIMAWNNLWKFGVRDSTGAYLGVTSDSNFAINTWYYLVGVLRNDTLYMYVNGVEKVGSSADGLYAATNNLIIGTYSTAYFNGTIDEVRIYNRALSASEVRYHYNRGAPVVEWNMDEGSGTKVYDSSGNADADFPAADANKPTWSTP